MEIVTLLALIGLTPPPLVPEPPPPETLMAHAREGLRAPPGCHLLEGRAVKRIGSPFGSDEETHVFRGTLDEGSWSVLEWEIAEDRREGFSVSIGDGSGESSSDDEGSGSAPTTYPFVPPGFGMPSQESEDTTGATWLLDALLEEFDPESEILTTYYDTLHDERVVTLSRLSTVTKDRVARELSLTVMHDRESLRPLRWEAVVEKGIPLGGVRAKNVGIELEAHPDGTPKWEHVSTTFVMGLVLRFKIDQEITYTRLGDCPSVESGPATPEGVDESD